MNNTLYRRKPTPISMADTVTRAMPLLVCMSLMACGGSHQTHEAHHLAAAQRSERLQAPDAEAVTLVGRFERLPNRGVRFGWSNSAMGFRFDGDAIGIVLAEDALHTNKSEIIHNMYEVVVDGEVMPPITVTSTTPQTFPITPGLLPGPHTVWVIKRTEGLVGSGVFAGLDIPPQTQLLPPPLPRDRRIEVYGASNETGYGNLGKATKANMCQYTPETQNAAVAYPALVADALQADLVNVSFSGKGILRTCTPGDNQPLPALADRIDPLFSKRWQDDPARAPQVIVVTLGPNDFCLGHPDRAAFARAYGLFLNKLRKRHPEAFIICTITPMMDGADRVVYQRWLAQIVAHAHDTRVHMLEFPLYTGDTIGCDWHPDEALHVAMAQQLQAAITQLTGWR